MNKSSFSILHETLQEALSERRLLDALQQLEELAKRYDLHHHLEDTHLLRQDYAMLLNYMKSGIADNEREKNYERFLRKAYAIADRMHRAYHLQRTEYHIGRVWRRLHQSQEAVADIYVPFVEGQDQQPATLAAILADPLASYAQLFDTIWTSAPWTPDDRHLVYAYVMNNDAPYLNRMTIVNAVGNALLFNFDEEKYLLLLSVVEEHQVEVSVRALLFSLYAYIVYRTRLPLYPAITLKFKFLSELTYFHPLVLEVQKSILVATESPILAQSIDDRLPEQMFEAHEHMKEIPDDMTHEEMSEYIEQHPKLRKFRNAMLDAMNEFVHMQQKGVDLNYHSFKHMRELTPFFDDACNWFCPFTNDHPLLFNISTALRFLTTITSAKTCDTDRYAIVLSMSSRLDQIHIVKKDAITLEETNIEAGDVEDFIKQVTDHLEQRAAEEDKSLLTISPERLHSHVVSAVQDSFRFFTLFQPYEMPNPFTHDYRLWLQPLFDNIFTHPDNTRDLADWLFELEHFTEATDLYNTLPVDLDILQRLGYISESLNDYTTAQKYYREALVHDPNDDWTVRQLIGVYRRSGDLESAQQLLETLLEAHPDDKHLDRQYAELLLAQQKYLEAQKVYSKLYYLRPKHLPTRRAFAWCLLCNGEYQRAAQLYDEILSTSKVKAEDYINAGHCTLLQGDIPSAVVYYQEALRLDNADYAPADFFDRDADFLRSQGITSQTQHLLIDLLNI